MYVLLPVSFSLQYVLALQSQDNVVLCQVTVSRYGMLILCSGSASTPEILRKPSFFRSLFFLTHGTKPTNLLNMGRKVFFYLSLTAKYPALFLRRMIQLVFATIPEPLGSFSAMKSLRFFLYARPFLPFAFASCCRQLKSAQL